MDGSFRSKLNEKLAVYRKWSRLHSFSGCRLVQYCGVERVGGAALAVAEVETRIESLFCEGFSVDWAELEGLLYLRVWEFDGPEPPWPKVFNEEHLADIDEIRREAG